MIICRMVMLAYPVTQCFFDTGVYVTHGYKEELIECFVSFLIFLPNLNKKKAIQARSAMDCCLDVTSWAVASRQWGMDIDMVRTQEEAGYSRA